MARFLLTSFSRHNRGMKVAYEAWYEEHIQRFLCIPSILSAQRFVKATSIGGDLRPPRHYLALYEIDAVRLESTLEDMYRASSDTVVPEDLFTTGDYSFTHIFWELQTDEPSVETFRRGVAGEHVATTFIQGAAGREAEFLAWTANATADSFGNGNRYRKRLMTSPDDPVTDHLLLHAIEDGRWKAQLRDVRGSLPPEAELSFSVVWKSITDDLKAPQDENRGEQ